MTPGSCPDRPAGRIAGVSAPTIWTIGHWTCPRDVFLRPLDEAGIDRLTGLARERRVAILCGEPMPWRCHRSVIANTLTAAGWQVWHLFTDGRPRLHELGQWGATPVVADDGRITYPRVSPS